jgi:hypothetical protein
MQQRAYTDIDQWIRDIELMCNNAMQYNMEGSSVYLDAEAIKVRGCPPLMLNLIAYTPSPLD